MSHSQWPPGKEADGETDYLIIFVLKTLSVHPA